MPKLSDDPDRIKVVHTYGVGLHTDDPAPDYDDPRWQQRQILDFVDFAVEAEELGFDGITVTEHHARAFACPAPHLLLAAAATRTSRIRLGTAVTVLPLYNPIRVAEEAGTLDAAQRRALRARPRARHPRRGRADARAGRCPTTCSCDGGSRGVELLRIALTEREFTFDGEFWQVPRPTTIATPPLQDPLPVWLGGASQATTEIAARNGWNVMRNFGTPADHRDALDHLTAVGREHGHQLTGANCMVERFVAIAETEEEAERNLQRMVTSIERFIAMYVERGASAASHDRRRDPRLRRPQGATARDRRRRHPRPGPRQPPGDARGDRRTPARRRVLLPGGVPAVRGGGASGAPRGRAGRGRLTTAGSTARWRPRSDQFAACSMPLPTGALGIGLGPTGTRAESARHAASIA